MNKLIASCFCLLCIPATFAERLIYHLELKNHLFYPSELIVPADVKIKLLIHNEDEHYEQFDSFDLNREKVIFSGTTATIYLGPLSVGRYQFFGEYHPNSAQGVVVVKSMKNRRNKHVIKQLKKTKVQEQHHAH